jgi:hypothetical protein
MKISIEQVALSWASVAVCPLSFLTIWGRDLDLVFCLKNDQNLFGLSASVDPRLLMYCLYFKVKRFL